MNPLASSRTAYRRVDPSWIFLVLLIVAPARADAQSGGATIAALRSRATNSRATAAEGSASPFSARGVILYDAAGFQSFATGSLVANPQDGWSGAAISDGLAPDIVDIGGDRAIRVAVPNGAFPFNHRKESRVVKTFSPPIATGGLSQIIVEFDLRTDADGNGSRHNCYFDFESIPNKFLPDAQMIRSDISWVQMIRGGNQSNGVGAAGNGTYHLRWTFDLLSGTASSTFGATAIDINSPVRLTSIIGGQPGEDPDDDPTTLDEFSFALVSDLWTGPADEMRIDNFIVTGTVLTYPDDVIAFSEFDSDDEGWTFVGDGSALTWQADDGNPGGHVWLVNPGSGATAFWVAPPKFLGNRSAAFGGHLLFDLATSAAANGAFPDDVRLRGGGLVLTLYDSIGPTTFPEWRSYRCVRLDTSSGWHVSTVTGPLATAGQIATVLASLEAIEIRADHNAGAETSHLDNVSLVAGQQISTHYTFDRSTEGWGFIGDGEAFVWQSTGGNPGGHIRVSDSRTGQYVYWTAPPSLVDAMKFGYGGRLTFDLSQSNAPNQDNGPYDVVLRSHTASLELNIDPEPAQYNNTNWTRYSVHLTECDYWRASGVPFASASQIEAVLNDLVAVQIKAEFHDNGPEVMRMDNVGFASPPCLRFSWAGTDDAFALPAEPASRSSHLSAALVMPALDFDPIPGVAGVTPNRQVAQSFTGLPASIETAILLLDLKAGDGGGGANGEGNDRIRLGFADASGFAEEWSSYIGSGNATPGLVSGPWTVGRAGVLGLDLSKLPLTGGGTMDLRPAMGAHGHLDVIIEDDTGVDYLRLGTAPCTGVILDVDTSPARNPAVSLSFGPNPARSVARFQIATPRSGSARLSVYDAAGRRVAVPFDGTLNGPTNLIWNLEDSRGRSVAAGVYFVTLEFGEQRARVGMIVIR